VALHGSEITLEKLAVRHRFGDLTAVGTVGLANIRDPMLRLTVGSGRVVVPVFGPELPPVAQAVSALDLKVEGRVSGALVSGTAHLAEFNTGSIDLSALWQEKPLAFPPVFAFAAEPWSAWRFDVRCATAEPAVVGALPAASEPRGTLAANVRLTGNGAAPVLSGTAFVSGVPATIGRSAPADDPWRVTVEEATLVFREDAPRAPTLDLRLRSELLGEEFQAHLVGPLNHHVRLVLCRPPLTPELVHAALGDAREGVKGDARFSLRVPAALAPGVEEHAWTEIETPVEPAPASRAENLDHLESAAAAQLQ
jgi:hypothetical protein